MGRGQAGTRPKPVGGSAGCIGPSFGGLREPTWGDEVPWSFVRPPSRQQACLDPHGSSRPSLTRSSWTRVLSGSTASASASSCRDRGLPASPVLVASGQGWSACPAPASHSPPAPRSHPGAPGIHGVRDIHGGGAEVQSPVPRTQMRRIAPLWSSPPAKVEAWGAGCPGPSQQGGRQEPGLGGPRRERGTDRGGKQGPFPKACGGERWNGCPAHSHRVVCGRTWPRGRVRPGSWLPRPFLSQAPPWAVCFPLGTPARGRRVSPRAAAGGR